LLKPIGDWTEVWDHWETLKQKPWFRKVISISVGLILSGLSWFTGHPSVMWFALGIVAGGAIDRLSTWLYERRRANHRLGKLVISNSHQHKSNWAARLIRAGTFAVFQLSNFKYVRFLDRHYRHQWLCYGRFGPVRKTQRRLCGWVNGG
jgi:hypothetical protein